MAGSGFRPLSKIPHCCRYKAFGPCLSSNVADHPLRSTKDNRLCELLPHQQPNPTRAHITTYTCKIPYNEKNFSRVFMRNCFSFFLHLYNFTYIFYFIYICIDLFRIYLSCKVASNALRTRLLLSFIFKYIKKVNLHVLSLSPAFILSQDQTLIISFSFYGYK